MTTKPKGKAAGVTPPMPGCGHKAAEDRLYLSIQALIADVACRRSLSAAEVVGVLTAVTHDVLAIVFAGMREQRRKAQAGEEKA